MPQVGEWAPDFELETDSGETQRLSELRGKRVILYFYPKADTPGCTTEACGFRDDFSSFEDKNAVILGVSPDAVKKQAHFKSKHNLPFPLLADSDHQVAEMYGVWRLKKMMGREYMGVVRTTFIIDEEGKISHVFEGVKPNVHSGEVLEALG
ncbi:MAG: peroxiredoxin [Chloroflexi bacterium RBG_16_48_8]|nr:MAG: peroxiredoxin [Chloroflexi bacterium RBG_16_48_8]